MDEMGAVNGLDSQLNDLKMNAAAVHEDLEVRSFRSLRGWH
jgi:hypothetical protein